MCLNAGVTSSAFRKGMPKILLVEDNEMNRDMLSRRLERKGYQIVLAVDGQSGVELAQAEAPDLILMDMSLPVLDGWEASRKLKADPRTRRVPIIALTAHVMAGDRERAIEAGCDDYDTKPVELSRLLGKIEALLPSKAVPWPPRVERVLIDDLLREQPLEKGVAIMGGKIDVVKGRIKEAAGALTGNDELRAEGETDQAVGKAKQAVQKAADTVKEAVKKVIG